MAVSLFLPFPVLELTLQDQSYPFRSHLNKNSFMITKKDMFGKTKTDHIAKWKRSANLSVVKRLVSAFYFSLQKTEHTYLHKLNNGHIRTCFFLN